MSSARRTSKCCPTRTAASTVCRATAMCWVCTSMSPCSARRGWWTRKVCRFTPRPCRKWRNTVRLSAKRRARRGWCSRRARRMAAGCSPISRGISAAWAKTRWNIRMKTAAGCATSHPTSAWRRWSTSATCAGSTTSSMPTRPRPTGRARILCWARAKRQ